MTKLAVLLLYIGMAMLIFSGCGKTEADLPEENPAASEAVTESGENRSEEPETEELKTEEPETQAAEPLFEEEPSEADEASAKTAEEATEEVSEEKQETEEKPETKWVSSEDLHLDNGIFSIDIPKELEGTYKAMISDEGIFIIDKVSEELMNAGYVFGIYIYEDPEDYIYDEHYTLLGQIDSASGKTYDVVSTYPTDLQYAPAKKDTYEAMEAKEEEIEASVKCTDGGTFTPEGEDTGATDNDPVTVSNVYKKVVEKHIQAIEEGWDQTKLEEEKMSYLYALMAGSSKDEALSKIGYLEFDVNSDGVDELFIGEVTDKDSKDEGLIYDMYTAIQRAVWSVASSGERDRFTLTTENRIREEASGGASNTEWSFYHLMMYSNIKEYVGGLKYDSDEDKANPWFKKDRGRDAVWEKVPEKDWNETMDSYGDYKRIDYVPLKDYKSANTK